MLTDQQIDEFLEMVAKSPTSARDMVRAMTDTNQKLREALLSDMDIAVLRMPVHLAFAGNMAQFQYHNRVQALLDRIEALATPTAEQVDDINVAESFTSVTKTAAPAQGEPFGHFRVEPFGWTDCAEDDEGAIALYERPQEVGLTDEEIEAIAKKHMSTVGDHWCNEDAIRERHAEDFARAIIAALRAKGDK